METKADTLAKIVLDSMLGLEYKHKIKLISLVKNAEELFDFPKKAEAYLAENLGASKTATIRSALKDEDYHRFVIDKLKKSGTKCITLGSEKYPFLLSQTIVPPFVLYCNGNTELLNGEATFAIVGSRKCMPDYIARAKNFSKELSDLGAVIVTGSAGGADTAAIEGALGSGRIISVLAGGVGHVYPQFNRSLVEDVAKRGLVVSEQPPDQESKPWMFPMRNRIIAGLSKGVLIVGGDLDSGARHTAYHAAEYGRDVFAFPYSLGVPSGRLNNELIKSGCELCSELKDVTDFLKLEKENKEELKLDGLKAEIYQNIASGTSDVYGIVEKMGIPVYELAPILSEMEIDGVIVKLSGNKYKTIK